ncbi:MAG: hypothetical protein CO002_00315 [Candidatus Portnoybacteria bacterium CG_4_8_14_3_um_filter_44_10]|uniref:Amino acid permease n=5 Tax=Candidatus Portnoyibacteriota TaxID=1817913 RepID=A0A2H0KQ54_9BACT|nr:MAG: hypothetical protein COV85_02990 [Candidatus Portnoybacteria bacterium CG11_big_fil_rev_8_21_14_0_20_44_10]PIS16906.1 MAG: hypothetical protein COT61_01455 [Candidatus Portnoybacteria bacterium CG09_land_8_20_14_0_10_44_13]PIW75747.1 MAG: hypothetical protein CO002_00315 [Candidatus Portnoybacteria bacterium CG_4_8_14_3_um_filter_44_10]PIZ68794.1 MAG: hypothetical protein COY11_05495 [Candidatus Portnoybacteria bacterium CG_4_10_14_0_2_um_filter_44_20]PJA62681.1 MAG: hypothetical protei
MGPLAKVNVLQALSQTLVADDLFREVDKQLGYVFRRRLSVVEHGIQLFIKLVGQFVTQAAAQYAGPGLILSFLISGVACAFAGLCYAEFASMMPVAGSAYIYARFSMGKFVGWIIGWNLILKYLFGAALVASGWSEYLTGFLKDIGIILPVALSQAPLVYGNQGWQTTGVLINLPAALIILTLSTLLVIGTKESARFNFLIVTIKILVILLFVGVGVMYINP